MTAALVVAVLVALGGAGVLASAALGWHRKWQQAADDLRWAKALTGNVGFALAKVWHHVTPGSPEEGAAVSVLRAAFPELPVPEESQSVPKAEVQRVLAAVLAARKTVEHCHYMDVDMDEARPLGMGWERAVRTAATHLGVTLEGEVHPLPEDVLDVPALVPGWRTCGNASCVHPPCPPGATSCSACGQSLGGGACT